MVLCEFHCFLKGSSFSSFICVLKGNMSISSSSSATDDLSGFSSAGGESTGRVVREEEYLKSKSSSATPSCMKDLNGAPTVDAPPIFERIMPPKNLRPGYQWVNPKVREFFSRYRSASELRSFLSHSQIYYSDIENDIISFQRVGNVDNVCHGREGDNYEFVYFNLVFLETFIFDCL